MGETALTITAQILVAAGGFAVTWGMVLSRLKIIERTLERHMEDTRENYVTISYFHAVIKPIQEKLNDLSHDTKKILMIVSRHDIN